MTTRRGFLGARLALAAAPAIVRVESLMPVAPRIWTPPEFGFYEGFRFIATSKATTDNVVTLAMIQRMTRELRRMKDNRADGCYWGTIHPGWHDALK